VFRASRKVSYPDKDAFLPFPDPRFEYHLTTWERNGGFELLIQENEKADWKKLVSWDSENSLTSGPVSFSKDGNYIYLLDSRNVNAGRLIKIEIATGNMEVIAQDPHYDVSGLMIHPDTYEIQAVAFYKARNELVVLDESIKSDFDAIAKLDHGDFFIYDRNNADDTWLVVFTKDNGPVSYYAFDRKMQKGTFLFDHMPDLKKYTLAPMEPISFTSRDGLTIHGYITFPPGKGRTNLPMVLNVHGGPWFRDTWGYNPEAQWLANRGYIYLQVNFRDSAGYGKEFLNAGNKEWGGKMHNDWLMPSTGRSGRALAIQRGLPSTVVLMAGMLLWWGLLSHLTSSAAR